MSLPGLAVAFLAGFNLLLVIVNAQSNSRLDLQSSYIVSGEDADSDSQVIGNKYNTDYLQRVRPDEILQHVSSDATRRFLFSPTIQNTITNLNQNQNKLELAPGSPPKEGGSYAQGEDFVNPETGDAEIDLRGQAKRICFIIA